MQNSKVKIDIKVRAYKFSLEIVLLCKSIKYSWINKVILNQLLRSATSISANIIEAQAGSSSNDFIKFMNYSLKSSNETKFWLQLSKDSKIISDEQATNLLDEAIQLSKILATIIKNTKDK